MNAELKQIHLDKNIRYFSPTRVPLSANVVLIQGKENLWLFDVGAHPFIPAWMEKQHQSVNIVLSHFHPDHTENLGRLQFHELYMGKNTYRYIRQGQIVESDLYLNDGELQLHIFPIPSSHSKGSLALEVNETYCFLGDAAYTTKKNGRIVYNTGLLQEQIKVLTTLKAPYFLQSHHEPFLQSRQEVLDHLQEIYSYRKQDEAYIEV